MSPERRRSPRGWTKIRIAVDGLDTELRPHSGNVSATGIYFEYDRNVGDPGKVEWLYLSSADCIVSLQIMACVVRTATFPGPDGKVTQGVALQFMPESDEAILQLRDFLHYVLALAADGVRAHDARSVGHETGVRSIVLDSDWELPVGAPVRIAIITRELPRTVRVEGRVVRHATGPSGGKRIEIAVQQALDGPIRRFSAGTMAAVVAPTDKVQVRARRFTPAFGIPFAKDEDFKQDERDREESVNEALEGLLGTLLEVRTQPKGAVRSHLAGELERIKLPTLLQVIDMDKMTGELELRRQDVARRLFFQAGRIVDIDPVVLASPREELRSVFGWADGSFDFNLVPVDRPDRVNSSTMALLLDIARESDEENRAEAADDTL